MVDAIRPASTPAPAPAAAPVPAGASAPALPVGEAVAARVQQILADGMLRLATAAGPLDVRTPAPIPVGTAVTVTMTETGTVRLALPETASAASRPAPAPEASLRPAVVIDVGAARPAAAGPPPPMSTPAVQTPQQAVLGALSASLARQDGLAPLVASLAAISSGQRPASEPVREVAGRVAALRLDGTGPVDGDAIRAAVETSGVFLEKRLAQGTAAAPDLKALLMALRETLRRPPGEAAPAPEPAPGRPDPAEPKAPRPPPPHRGEAPSPERAAAGPAAAGATDTIERTLLERTEAALARIRLAQIASLPAEIRPPDGRSEPSQASMQTHVPLVLGEQTAVLSLAVERDGAGEGGEGDPGPLWRLWFALDAEPAGPVTGLVTLRGASGVVGVTLWAERTETQAALRDGLVEMRGDLEAEAFTVADVSARLGHPHRRGREAHYLDRTT